VSQASSTRYAVIAPDGKEGMLQHAAECRTVGIPYLFDPGQGLPMLSSEEILYFLDGADALAVNDYEAELISTKTGLSLSALAAKVSLTVVTRGALGSTLYVDGEEIQIPSVPPDAVVDPTGCGDAYRGGLLFGLAEGWHPEKAGRLASLMGSIKIAYRGGQNHALSQDEIARRYEEAFGETLF
jgi:adenosine kinase